MTFQELYSSPWILPVLPWAAMPIVLVLAARRRGFFRVWGVLFAVLIAVDAGVNGAWTPVHTPGVATLFGIAFVILGDLRYFLAVERDAGRFFAPVAIGLALVVPLLSQIARAAIPAVAAELRVTYLAYEVLFLAVLAAYSVLRVRSLGGPARAFATKLTLFVAAQYALWASADVLILTTRSDAGYLLRIVPDVMYYVAFVPFALRLAASRKEAT